MTIRAQTGPGAELPIEGAGAGGVGQGADSSMESVPNPWDRLEAAIQRAQANGAEIIVTLKGSEYGWTSELRYIPNPNRAHAADVALTFYAVGDIYPEDSLEQCLDELEHPRVTRALKATDRAHRGMPRWDELNRHLMNQPIEEPTRHPSPPAPAPSEGS